MNDDVSSDGRSYAVFQIERAFADCHGKKQPFGKTKDIRNLDFRASYLFTVSEAQLLLEKYCSEDNNFTPDLLRHLPPDCLVRIAREGSVCLYIELQDLIPNIPELQTQLLCDELDLHQTVGGRNVYRIWWD